MNKFTYTLIILVVKYCCLAGLMISIVSCQSTMDNVGEQHKTAAAKWYALANYAQSDIQRYGVTITGKLTVDFDDPRQSFKLSHFKLSTGESIKNVNLLMPTFENKHICVKQCYQLLEYVNFSGESGTTLLTSYFSEHEFELFKFYGEIQILNEQLVYLAQLDRVLLGAYLQSLAYKDISFQTAKEFTQYLANVLTLTKFNEFMLNPIDVFSPFLNNYHIEPEVTWTTGLNQEKRSWDEQLDTLGNNWVLEGSPELETIKNMSFNSEAPWLVKLPEPLLEENKSSTLIIAKQASFWPIANKAEIKVGNNACSYQKNYFGIVVSITNTNVEMKILGQAKEVTEGVVSDAAKGSLFTNMETIYFLPQAGKKSFSKADVAVCNLE